MLAALWGAILLQPTGNAAAPNVQGTVRQSAGDTARPSPGAFVSILSSAGHLLATTRADRHGRYQFSQIAPGRYFVTASRPGYFVSRAGGRAGVRLAIECSKNCLPSEADIELVRGSVLTGLVVDASGDPVERAKVSTNRAASGQSLLNAIDDWTDDRGHFRIAGLRPGSYAVSVQGGSLTSLP